MNRKTRQILMAAVVLASVTALSFGIKQVRVIVHRASIAQTPVANDVGSEQSSAKETIDSGRNPQVHDAPLEQDQQSADAMPDSQEVFAKADDEAAQEQPDDRYGDPKHSGKHADAVSKSKSFKGGYIKSKDDYAKSKGDYGKSEGPKGLQKISISEHENLYITDKGERWYVAENPDGSITKTQVQEVDGEFQPVGETNTYPSGGGKGGQDK